MFYFDDYYIANFDDYAIDELTKIVEKLYHIAGEYRFGTREYSFFMGLGDLIEEPIRIRKDNKMIEERNKEMNFEELKIKVEQWAEDKDLLHEENADKQFMKFIEEVFEFKTEMDILVRYRNYYRENPQKKIPKAEHERITKKAELELGDIIVTLIVLSKQLDIDIVECLNMAYEKISKRRGKTIDGTFVKEEDL